MKKTISFLPLLSLIASLAILPGFTAKAQINWTNYTTTEGLGNNGVNGVYADGSNIYAATFNGLSISTDAGANWTNYTTTEGLGNNSVNGVYADGSNIYAATNGGLSVGVDTDANTGADAEPLPLQSPSQTLLVFLLIIGITGFSLVRMHTSS